MTLTDFSKKFNISYKRIWYYAAQDRLPVVIGEVKERGRINRRWWVDDKDVPELLAFFGLTDQTVTTQPDIVST